jgi:2-hydroxy-3-keto-5-methylthiopentenyl-1-phosphate phosphatase
VPPAELTPRFQPAGVPLSILVDYDGTVSVADVGDLLLAEFVADHGAVLELDARFDDGEIGSRALIRWDMDVLPDDPDLLRSRAATVPQDQGFVDLVHLARAHGAGVEVVSDGLGFYVEAKLASLGVVDVPVATNVNRLRGGPGMAFPFGHSSCFVCGTCKRERVRAHQAAGHLVAFVGDGTSDRYAAHHADLVFAKGKLATWCARAAVPFHGWDRLADVVAWFERALAAADLPSRASGVAAWRAARATGRPSFVCGPEVWGPGRANPVR